MTVFVEGNKYIIKGDKIYSIYDGVKHEVNLCEYQKVKNFLKKIKGDVFRSSKLNEIAKMNPSIKNIDILHEVLDDIEEYIPKYNRNSFYNNLESLNINIENYQSLDNEKYWSAASYKPLSNKITLRGKTLHYSRDEAERLFIKQCEEVVNECDMLSYEEILNSIIKDNIVHELIHMASTSADDYREIVWTGLDEHYYDGEYEEGCHKCFFINEGLTEIITNDICKSDIGYHISGYKPEIRITKQLIGLVGFNFIKDCYFNNKGLIPIKLKLDEYRDDIYFDFYKEMEDFCDNRYASHIIKIQDLLISYYEKALEEAYKEEDTNRVKELLNTLKNNLIDETFYESIDYIHSHDSINVYMTRANNLISKYNTIQKIKKI